MLPNSITPVIKIISLCSFANFINSADRMIMPIAIIRMAKEFKWSLHTQGWILSAFAIGFMSSMIVGGTAAKRFGGKIILFLAVFTWSLSTLLTPIFAQSPYTLMFLRMLLGVGEGFGLPTIFHIFSNAIPPEERSRSFGYLIAFGSIGQTLAAIVCPLIAWRMSFIYFGFAGLIWCFLWVKFYADSNSSGGSLPVFNNQSSSNGRSINLRGFMTEEEINSYASVHPLSNSNNMANNSVYWKEYISHWPLWSNYIAHFSMNWTNYLVLSWLPTYLITNLGASQNQIAYTAFPLIMNSVVSISSGHIADNLISKGWSVLRVRRLMTAIGLVGPGIFVILFSSTNGIALAVLLITISMSFSGCNSAGHMTNHAEIAPNHAGITFAISNTLATIPGILCGPLTAELVFQSEGRWFPAFLLAGLLNITSGVVYLGHSGVTQVI